MGELDRRARKKALTREEIRRTAQELFAARGFHAVTIADIAATADVAVQTVFNHFATKEELFFDGHTPWIDGPAEAVRNRRRGEAPLAALRAFTVEWIREAARPNHDEQHRLHVTTLEASPALRAFERGLQARAEQRLSDALHEAWTSDPAAGPRDGLDPRVAATLTAALWGAGARTLLVELRAADGDGADVRTARKTVEILGERLFERLERGLGTLLQLPEPVVETRHRVRRAG